MNQDQIIEAVEKMTVLELNALVKSIEEKWGVSAQATAAAPAAGGAAAGEEKSAFNVHLTDAGAAKVAVIKAVKDALGLGLKEGLKKEDADKLKAVVEAAGGKVELK
jgi:large subunit ribosomal protein L7/L12